MTEKQIKEKIDEAPKPLPRGAAFDDFYAYLPKHQYIYKPTGDLWPPESVNAITSGMSRRLDKTRAVQQMTWCPGAAKIVKDKLVVEGGWIEKPGAQIFNLYMPPKQIAGDPNQAGPWLAHGEKLFGAKDHRHVLNWCAWKVQHPDIKINHGILMGSPKQGVGKDSWLRPVRRAVGDWNFKDVSAQRATHNDRNFFLASTIVRVNEVHDLGKDRFNFYDFTKDWMAGPPETLMVRKLFADPFPIFNLVGVIITTNHKTDGLYLPRDDRRHYVAWSEILPEAFGETEEERDRYFQILHNWFDGGGLEHCAAYLATLDLSGFNPFSPPEKTDAWHAIVAANESQEEADLANVLDYMGGDPLEENNEIDRPKALTLARLKVAANAAGLAGDEDAEELHSWLSDRRNGRAIMHRLEASGYSIVQNPGDKRDGRWKIGGKGHAVYAQSSLSIRERSIAVRALIKSGNAAAERKKAAERKRAEAKADKEARGGGR